MGVRGCEAALVPRPSARSRAYSLLIALGRRDQLLVDQPPPEIGVDFLRCSGRISLGVFDPVGLKLRVPPLNRLAYAPFARELRLKVRPEDSVEARRLGPGLDALVKLRARPVLATLRNDKADSLSCTTFAAGQVGDGIFQVLVATYRESCPASSLVSFIDDIRQVPALIGETRKFDRQIGPSLDPVLDYSKFLRIPNERTPAENRDLQCLRHYRRPRRARAQSRANTPRSRPSSRFCCARSPMRARIAARPNPSGPSGASTITTISFAATARSEGSPRCSVLLTISSTTYLGRTASASSPRVRAPR